MTELLVKASSDEVGLRRESRVEVGDLPMWLARLQLALPAGTSVRVSFDDETPIPVADLIEGAGFSGPLPELTRERTLPDFVSPELRFLVCGLNPSLHAADAGIGFVTKSNRFWTSASKAGIVTSDRDPVEANTMDGVGFTDLAKRATTRADELSRPEFQAGLSRVERLCRWLRPRTVIMVGLAGWRAATDPAAAAGWQRDPLGPSPVYLMPNTSGLNAHETVETLTAHFEAAAAGPPD